MILIWISFKIVRFVFLSIATAALRVQEVAVKEL
jgi:hypothetical protein